MKNSHSQDSKKQEKVATVMGPGMLGGPWGHPFSSLGLSFPISRIRIGAFQLWCWRRLLRALVSLEIKPVNPKGNQS